MSAVPKFGDRISLFTKKLRIAQYADNSIYDYRLKIAQAVLFFKHMVFGLKAYYNVMGYKEPKGLVLPQVRKPKRLPRVLSQNHQCRK